MGGLPHTQEEEESSERPLQKGSARQEKIPQASSLIPNGSFKYQVKLLALRKSQTEGPSPPLPLLVPKRAQEQQRIHSLPPWGLIYSTTLQTSCRVQSQEPTPGTTWKDPRASKTAFHFLLSLLREGLDPE